MFHMDHDKCSLASYQTMDVGLMIAIEANGDAPEPPSSWMVVIIVCGGMCSLCLSVGSHKTTGDLNLLMRSLT